VAGGLEANVDHAFQDAILRIFWGKDESFGQLAPNVTVHVTVGLLDALPGQGPSTKRPIKSGEDGIRTRGAVLPAHRFSKPSGRNYGRYWQILAGKVAFSIWHLLVRIRSN